MAEAAVGSPAQRRAIDSPKGKTGKLAGKKGWGETPAVHLKQRGRGRGIGQTQRRNDKSVGEETRAQRRQNFRRMGWGTTQGLSYGLHRRWGHVRICMNISLALEIAQKS